MAVTNLRRILIYAACALAVLAAGAWSMTCRGHSDGVAVELASSAGGIGEESVGPTGHLGGGSSSTNGDGPAAPTSSTTDVATIFVQIAGEVRRPGVYEVPAGSRLFEVLARAGGTTPAGDEQALPLAAALADGARVVVPARGAGEVSASGVSGGSVGPLSPAGGAATGAPSGAGGTPLSLAGATVEQLDALPGIGPSLARQIVAYRDAHGGFNTVADLDEVPGIGPATMAKLEGLVVP